VPARHRHHDSTERRKLFTITLESCSRSAGIRVHDAVETVITMSHNMQPAMDILEGPGLSMWTRRKKKAIQASSRLSPLNAKNGANMTK
jgi:hypothetical protein